MTATIPSVFLIFSSFGRFCPLQPPPPFVFFVFSTIFYPQTVSLFMPLDEHWLVWIEQWCLSWLQGLFCRFFTFPTALFLTSAGCLHWDSLFLKYRGHTSMYTLSWASFGPWLSLLCLNLLLVRNRGGVFPLLRFFLSSSSSSSSQRFLRPALFEHRLYAFETSRICVRADSCIPPGEKEKTKKIKCYRSGRRREGKAGEKVTEQ